jgi:putative flippase GtrA
MKRLKESFFLLSKSSSSSFTPKLLKFALAGACGTVLNLSILYFLTEFLHVFYILSELVAICTAFMFNFMLNVKLSVIDIHETGRREGEEGEEENEYYYGSTTE